MIIRREQPKAPPVPPSEPDLEATAAPLLRRRATAPLPGNFGACAPQQPKMAAHARGGLAALGAQEAAAAAHALSLPAEAFGNDPNVEMVWAVKAYQHAQVYFNLISSVDPKFLKLTKADDQIYSDFRKNFSDLKIDVLDSEDLKSGPAKEVGLEVGV